MAEFEDKSGTRWALHVNVEVIRRVRAETGYDLAQVFTADGMNKLAADVCLLVDVLCVMAGGQVAQKGLTAAKFGELFDGETLEAATNALLEASIDFLPLGRREVIRKLWGKADEVATAAAELVEANVDKLTPESLGLRPKTSGST
jgi:hypothetical protein